MFNLGKKLKCLNFLEVNEQNKFLCAYVVMVKNCCIKSYLSKVPGEKRLSERCRTLSKFVNYQDLKLWNFLNNNINKTDRRR